MLIACNHRSWSKRKVVRLAAQTLIIATLTLIMVSAPGEAATSSKTVPFDPTPFVHPELRPALKILERVTNTPLSIESLKEVRKSSFNRPIFAKPAWSTRTIPGPAGAPPVGIYIVNAAASDILRPVILHMHGGGFIRGEPKSDIGNLQQLAEALGCVIVSVDYRLAPETRFPGALEDNYAALKWLHRHGREIGADPARIALMGESAGGGHAAMLAIAARDRREVSVVFQALIYPMLDDRTGSTRKVAPHQGTIVWTPAKNRFGWGALLGQPAGSAKAPYGSVPSRVADLKGLPPTFIGVGSIDLFVDENIDYARRLIDAGISTELTVIPGAFHGFDNVPNTSIAKAFRADLINALRNAFAEPLATTVP